MADLPKTKTTDSDSGILQPPEDIKSIIDKTAVWVARNGSSFEAKVAEKQKDNPQFAFLRPGNAYYAYYQQKVREIRREEGIATEGDAESVQSAAELRLQIKKTLLGELPLEDEDSKKRKKKTEEAPLEPPPPEEWIVDKPSMPAVQEDILKLTAQFVARNGPVFQNGLMAREGNNPQFGFLLPFHPLHHYFKALVQQYTNCLLVERGVIESLEKLALDKPAVIDRVMKKVRWERAQKKTADLKRQEEEAERNAMAQIDWHDFAVVQVIDFEEETEAEPVPEPIPVPTSVPPPSAIPSVGAPTSATIPPSSEAPEVDMDVEMDVDEELPPAIDPLKATVRADFNPRAKPATAEPVLKFITPSGQEVVPQEVSEHMKIETANIRALEERKKREQAERPSNLVNDVELIKSLKGFASQRPDIFVDAAAAPKERPVVKPAVWDGHSSSIPKVTQAAQANKADQSQAAQESKPVDTIGPKIVTPSSQPTVPPKPPTQFAPVPANLPPNLAPPMGMPPMGMPPMGMGGPMLPMIPGVPPPQFPGQPLSLQPHQRPPPTDEPAAKRPRTDEGEAALPGMVTEREWIASRPGPITVVVKVPTIPDTPFPLNGQVLQIPIKVSELVKTLKEKVSEQLQGMPPNKQKLQLAPFGVLNDNKTLAFYNLQNGVEVDLGMKERGGRKK